MSTTYWLVTSGIAAAGRTPPSVRSALASTATSASYLGWRSKRLVTQENMGTVLGLPAADPVVRRTAFRSWRNYGRTAADLVTLPYADISEIVADTQDLTEGMPWRECLRLARPSGRGAIITTGHFGSWDLAGAVVAREVPLSAVADTFKDPRLNSLLQGHRRDKSVDVIPVGGAGRLALQHLVAGRTVAIVVDRPVAADRGVPVTFFGRRTYVPAGAATLAVKSGAAVVPGFFWYASGGRYNLRAFPPLFPRPASTPDERRREVERLTQYMFACQEQVVRQCPTQWFMFRRFWPQQVALDEPGGLPLRAA